MTPFDAQPNPDDAPDDPAATDATPGNPDPFAPLAATSKAAAPKPPPEVWEPMLPAPGEPPEAGVIRHPAHGAAARTWTYRDREGRPLFAVARFEVMQADGRMGKETMPYCYGRRVWTTRSGRNKGNRADKIGWHFKAPPKPRPLYGLDRLAQRPDAPVLVCEGEKAADAAGLIFPDHVAITSQGGSQAAGLADWTPLAGRSVTLWPDQDAPGLDFAAKVAERCAAIGADPVLAVQVPQDWPDGWDLADPLPDGIAAAELPRLLADAQPPEAGTVLPERYHQDWRGLHFKPYPSERNRNPDPIFVAAPFTVVGETNDGAGQDWGLHLRWHDRDGRAHQWAVPKRMVHADGNAIAAELEHLGLHCAPTRAAHEALKGFIAGVRSPRRLQCVGRIGWHQGARGPVFMLPGSEAFGPGASSVILQGEGAANDGAFRSAGTLADWQRDVAAHAVGNDRLALFLSAAFAGALLDVAAEPSGGVHLVGGSRTGKTSASYAAGSVWGRGDEHGQVRGWRSTANGLEGIAAETSDTVLILDEMGQADPREVGDIVYMLANSGGKARAGRGGEARRRRTWRTLLLSTGELTLASKMGEAGKRAMAGLEVRLISLPADAGQGMGAFQQLHGKPNAAALADHLRIASRTGYGTAGRAYLAHLVRDRAADPDGLRRFVDDVRAGFIKQHVPGDANGQVQSVAGRFALIAAAGELARDYDVLNWPEGEATRAAGACFQAWLAARGGSGSAEDAQALAQVRAFIEQHGESRFTVLGGADPQAEVIESRTVNRAGFRERVTKDGVVLWHYLILPQTWAAEVCKGLDAARAAKALLAAGYLARDDDKHLTCKRRLPGLDRPRVYVVRGDLLGGGDAE